MRIVLFVLPVALLGCDSQGDASRFQYVNRPQFESSDFVFDKQTGCLAVINVELPKEISVEQFQAKEAIPETIKGFEDWKCPKPLKKVEAK